MIIQPESLGFITSEDIAVAPEGASAAFLFLVERAEERLVTFVVDAGETSDILLEIRRKYMNSVVGLARGFNIEPFASFESGVVDRFDSEIYNNFRADLDRYLVQLRITHGERSKVDSVMLSQTMKDRVRTYVNALRSEIEKANIGERRKETLLKKIKEFEVELERSRTSLLVVTRVVFTILATPGAVWASYELVQKLASNLIETVAEAKGEEEKRLSSPESVVALLPPKR